MSSVQCPLCGYVMSAFDKECPRCHGKGLQPSPPQQQGQLPPSAPRPQMPPVPQPQQHPQPVPMPPQQAGQKPPPPPLPHIVGQQILDVCCPHCRKFAPQYFREGLDATNPVCYWCNQQFFSQLVEIRAKRSQGTHKTNSREFQVRVFNAHKTEELIQFHSRSYEDFELRARDKVIFSSMGGHVIVVQNLSIQRIFFTRSLNKNCYVATCVYGEDSSEVAILRAYRDEKLLPNPLGTALVNLYYFVSPHAVRKLGNASLFRGTAHLILQPVIATLARSTRRRIYKTRKRH